jgi:hypothetical protein
MVHRMIEEDTIDAVGRKVQRMDIRGTKPSGVFNVFLPACLRSRFDLRPRDVDSKNVREAAFFKPSEDGGAVAATKR